MSAPAASPPVPPPRDAPAKSHRPPPPPPARETARNTCAMPASRRSPGPPVRFSLLLPAPSCNKISGEDLRQRGSSRASFRTCASSTYSTLGGTPFVFITSEPRVLHCRRSHYAKDLCSWAAVHPPLVVVAIDWIVRDAI